MKLPALPSSLRRRLSARTGRWATVVALGFIGGILAILLAGNVHSEVGPFETTLSVRPDVRGGTNVELAPLGSLALGTHAGPATLDVRVDRVDVSAAQQLLKDPNAVSNLENDVAHDVRSGLVELGWKTAIVGALGGAALALIRRFHWTSAVVGGGTALAVIAASFASAAVTFKPSAISEPRYTGLLTLAPKAIGNAKDISSKFGVYQSQVNELVANLSRLYETTEATSTLDTDENTVRILHVSDLHLNPAAFTLIKQMIQQFHPVAVIDTGDINDWGTTFEDSFAQPISTLGVPYIFIRGNHDSASTEAAVRAEPNAVVLDNATTDIDGIHIWGIGDSRYTADKELFDNLAEEKQAANNQALVVQQKLLAAEPPFVDVALVHDPATAASLGGIVPLVLAGHLHSAQQRSIGNTPLLVEGSTGGAGLRGVAETGDSVPLQCSMLYFDRTTRRLNAYDQITVKGLGESGAQIERHVMPSAAAAAPTTTTTTTAP